MRGTIVEVDPGRAREAWVELLELADEPAPLRRYLDDGRLYGVADDTDGQDWPVELSRVPTRAGG